jgi:hypothetical protein
MSVESATVSIHQQAETFPMPLPFRQLMYVPIWYQADISFSYPLDNDSPAGFNTSPNIELKKSAKYGCHGHR